ncbi:MAG: aminotransferase class I/II-fold pyridoxal phosphate-dependent enzyme [Acidimicrobiia bacterium]
MMGRTETGPAVTGEAPADELAIARWATTPERSGTDQWLRIPTGPRPTPMDGASATGEALVSNGRLGADIIRLAAGERFRPHAHPGDHLLVVLAGEGTVTRAGKVHSTSAGDVYLVEGGVPHAVGAVTDHVILAVGAPHRRVDAPDRQVLTSSEALIAPSGELGCRICSVVAVVPERLCDRGCVHCPCEACSAEQARAASEDTEIPRWPALEPEDVKAATAVLRSGRLSQTSGSAVAEFENALAEYHDAAYAIALCSGTSAVDLALAAIAIGPGDEVIVPSHTFVASASPILARGARPVFADVDPATFCLSPASVEAALTEHTRAIVAVHLNGHPADVPALLGLGERLGVPVVEDTAQAIGARLGEHPAGTLGLAGCFSFWEDKIITTAGEGGAVVTDDASVAAGIRRLRDHGHDRLEGTDLFASHVLGGNHRLTAVQAAVGRSQLRRLSAMLSARRRNADRLTAELPAGVEPPVEGPGCTHAYWKYVCRLRTSELGCDIDTFVRALQRRGVPALRRYPVPVHRHPLFQDRGFGREHLPVTDALADELFSLPVHPLVTDRDIDRMLESVAKAVVECSS